MRLKALYFTVTCVIRESLSPFVPRFITSLYYLLFDTCFFSPICLLCVCLCVSECVFVCAACLLTHLPLTMA